MLWLIFKYHLLAEGVIDRWPGAEQHAGVVGDKGEQLHREDLLDGADHLSDQQDGGKWNPLCGPKVGGHADGDDV